MSPQDGHAQHNTTSVYTAAHVFPMLPERMIAANGATVRDLEARGVPMLRRVLRVPKRWDRIVESAARLGEHLPAAPDAAALEAFLAGRQQADPPRFPDLSLSVIKLLGRALRDGGTWGRSGRLHRPHRTVCTDS